MDVDIYLALPSLKQGQNNRTLGENQTSYDLRDKNRSV